MSGDRGLSGLSDGGWPPGRAPVRGLVRRSVLGLVLGLVLGALTWAGWLGWDDTTSYDIVTDSLQGPYVTLQVLGCALCLGVVTALLAARTQPAAAAIGTGVGFWVVWTLNAAAFDETGLFIIGAVMLACGLAVGTPIAALVGWSIQQGRHERTAKTSTPQSDSR